MKPYVLVGHSRPITRVMFNYSGELLFSSCNGGTLCVWDPDNAVLLKRYKFKVDDTEAEKSIQHFDVTFDSDKLVVGRTDGVFILDVTDGKQLLFVPLEGVCRFVEWNKQPNNQNMFVAARAEFTTIPNAILIYKVMETSESYVKLLEITDFPATCVGASWGPYDETIISWHEDGTMYIWSATDGTKIAEAKHFQTKITYVDFSKDRTVCLCCSMDKTSKLLLTMNLELVQEYKTDRPLNTCSLSPFVEYSEPLKKRMHLLVAGGQDVGAVTTTKLHEGKSETVVIHLVTADVLGFIGGHFSPINTICFSPDGAGFATGAVEGNVRVYKFDPSYFRDPVYD